MNRPTPATAMNPDPTIPFTFVGDPPPTLSTAHHQVAVRADRYSGWEVVERRKKWWGWGPWEQYGGSNTHASPEDAEAYAYRVASIKIL